MDLDLNNVHVLVTGASGCIGLETVHVFLKQGSKVTAHYNTNPKTLEPLIAEFGPQKVQALQADLTSESDVARLFSQASSSFGPIQVVIINHGVWPLADHPVVQMPLDRWRSTIDINLTAPFLVARAYLQGLQTASDEAKGYASIIFIGSSSGKFGEAGHSDYAASKSAMMYGLTMTLKNEIVKIAPRGRVNCIAPGWVVTPITKEALKYPLIVYRSLATTPMKKYAFPNDIANQIAVLSSRVVSGHVTGEVIMVDGGMEGRLLNLPEDMET